LRGGFVSRGYSGARSTLASGSVLLALGALAGCGSGGAGRGGDDDAGRMTSAGGGADGGGGERGAAPATVDALAPAVSGDARGAVDVAAGAAPEAGGRPDGPDGRVEAGDGSIPDAPPGARDAPQAEAPPPRDATPVGDSGPRGEGCNDLQWQGTEPDAYEVYTAWPMDPQGGFPLADYHLIRLYTPIPRGDARQGERSNHGYRVDAQDPHI
jgi:hypothetical protein